MFAGKVVVITGATSGIGEATAHRFADYGATIILIGRNKEKGLELQSALSLKTKVEFLQCDVSDEGQVKLLSNYIAGCYHQVDVLFNNAGVMLPSMEIERMPFDDWEKTFQINVNGTFFMCKYLKELILKVKGTIINNASIAGMQHYAAGRSYAYSASKAAIIQFSHQMAKNYGEEGVRVNCICPGIIDTKILGDRDRSVYAKRIPLGYVAGPEKVAKVVVFLASPDADYLTGVVLPIDGGASL